MKNFAKISIFCANIKYLRTKQKLSQKQMAQALGISAATLSKIEKGILPPRLSCEILFRIEEHFGIHPKDMFL